MNYFKNKTLLFKKLFASISLFVLGLIITFLSVFIIFLPLSILFFFLGIFLCAMGGIPLGSAWAKWIDLQWKEMD